MFGSYIPIANLVQRQRPKGDSVSEPDTQTTSIAEEMLQEMRTTNAHLSEMKSLLTDILEAVSRSQPSPS